MSISTPLGMAQANRFGHALDMLEVKPRRRPAGPANRLREWRVAARLSQEELAEKVGSTGVSIGRYETGKRSLTIEMLEQFAAALDCKPADLLPDPESVLDDEERALLADLRELPAEHRRTLLDLAAALRLQEELRERQSGLDAAPSGRLLRRYN